MTRTHGQFMSAVDGILSDYVSGKYREIVDHMEASFSAQFGPAGHVPPLPWDDEPSDGEFYDDVEDDDLPLPVSFPLGNDAE